MAYLMTVENASGADREPVELEPPRQGYAIHEIAPKRNDELIIIWRNPDVVDVEVRGLDDVRETLEEQVREGAEAKRAEVEK